MCNDEASQLISRITKGPTETLFRGKILGKYDVDYFRCRETGFIQTEAPFWLEEAYSDAITSLDIGLLSRNISKADLAEKILRDLTDPNDRLLDFGGGYGVFVRLMRDRGYQFEIFDQHCQPIFANRHQLATLDDNRRRFACITAWEVFEHLTDPVATFAQLFQLSDRLLISTVLIPHPVPKSIDQWWYFTPETGQHVSFFSSESLRWVAGKFDMHLYSDGIANHLFSKQKLNSNPLKPSPWLARMGGLRSKINRLVTLPRKQQSQRHSLRESDYQAILDELRDQPTDNERQ